ncbi:putative cytochrome P450 [Mycobacteroides abscessus subsp. abscessus]|nr:putative cytochrome P450 [Mycobacteroides abscessus subsp. abscessus]
MPHKSVGLFFPEHTAFGLGWYSMHMDPRWWPEPEKFNPSRFTDKEKLAARPRNAFVPFDIGKAASAQAAITPMTRLGVRCRRHLRR